MATGLSDSWLSLIVFAKVKAEDKANKKDTVINPLVCISASKLNKPPPVIKMLIPKVSQVCIIHAEVSTCLSLLSRIVLDKVKEFVKGGEFEKIHRNETQTRDRDELSR